MDYEQTGDRAGDSAELREFFSLPYVGTCTVALLFAERFFEVLQEPQATPPQTTERLYGEVLDLIRTDDRLHFINIADPEVCSQIRQFCTLHPEFGRLSLNAFKTRMRAGALMRLHAGQKMRLREMFSEVF